MDGPRDYYTKWNKSEGEKQVVYDITYMWKSKKKTIQMNLFTKQNQTHRLWKQPSGYQRGKGERIN